jgi:hypothetical protein
MRTRILAALAAALLLLPGTSLAFSFGSFAPGEKIVSVQLAVGNLANPVVTFDGTTNTMIFDASVSTITTNLNTFSIPLGDVIFTSQIMIQGGTEQVFQPFPPFFGGQLGAEFLNGVAADLSIIDVAGLGLLLEAEYDGTLSFQANVPGMAGLPVVGSLDGAFDVSGGDVDFLAAFGPAGNFFANLANFSVAGNPVGGNMCLMIAGGCPGGTTIGNFAVNPNVTITPTPIPEPGVAALLVLGLGVLALRRSADR